MSYNDQYSQRKQNQQPTDEDYKKWVPSEKLVYYNPTGNDGMKAHSHFNQSTIHTNPNFKCPHCFSGKEYFELPQDYTNTIYCGNCRQPFHHCPQHKTPIKGPGYRKTSQSGKNCQCVSGEGFLHDDQWNSAFRR